MKLAVGGGLMIGVAALVISAGAAHADGVLTGSSVEYIRDMHANEFSNDRGDETLLAVGDNICTGIAGGRLSSDLANELYLNSSLSRSRAAQYVRISVNDLCPQLADRLVLLDD